MERSVCWISNSNAGCAITVDKIFLCGCTQKIYFPKKFIDISF